MINMSEELKSVHNAPSDIEQIPIIWRYELLKYLRSWRLYASFAIVAAVMMLLYLLPPLLGESYSGTDTKTELWVVPLGDLPDMGTIPFEVYAVGTINRSQIDVDSVVLYRDGAEYPAMGAWTLTEVSYGSASIYTILFLSAVVENLVLAGGFDTIYGIDLSAGARLRGQVTRRDLLLEVADCERLARSARAGSRRGRVRLSHDGRPALSRSGPEVSPCQRRVL